MCVGGAARVMAALRRSRAICVFVFPFCAGGLSAVLELGMMRCSAAYCKVRVTAGSGRAVPLSRPGERKSGISHRQWNLFRSKAACAASPRPPAALEDATHTSRAALRPGTAAVVNVSAGLDGACPLGSVVTAGSASFNLPRNGVDAGTVASSGFGSAADFFRVEAGDAKHAPTQSTSDSPV